MYRVWGSGFRGLGCGVLERTYKRVYKGSGIQFRLYRVFDILHWTYRGSATVILGVPYGEPFGAWHHTTLSKFV